MRSRRGVLALLSGVVLCGCAGSTPFRPRAYDEAVRVQAVEVSFDKEGAGRLAMRLAVHNPAGSAAVLSQVDFELRVDGRRVAVGAQAMDLSLAAKGESTVDVRFPLSTGRHLTEGGEEKAAAHQVRVDGGVTLRFGGTERRAPFRDVSVARLAYVPRDEPEEE